MGISLPGGALTRKSIADVTRRRLRTILVVLGIAIGVLGLTAINFTSGSLSESISFSANRSSFTPASNSPLKRTSARALVGYLAKLSRAEAA